MRIESEYKDINGIHHVTISGDYGIMKSGDGGDRDELIARIAGQVQLAEIEARAYRGGERDCTGLLAGVAAIVLTVVGILWLIK